MNYNDADRYDDVRDLIIEAGVLAEAELEAERAQRSTIAAPRPADFSRCCGFSG
jgi:hypothetical protein